MASAETVARGNHEREKSVTAASEMTALVLRASLQSPSPLPIRSRQPRCTSSVVLICHARTKGDEKKGEGVEHFAGTINPNNSK